MCGRYTLEQQGLEDEFSQGWSSRPIINLGAFVSNWNAAPTQLLPVLVEEEDDWELSAMTWGLIPRWTKPGERPKVAPINARSETVAEKPMFRGLVKRNRCIVPASGFYEWKKVGARKQPYYIHPTQAPLMLFAGLYDEARDADGKPLRSYTILTTEANDAMTDLHDRMPVMLSTDDVEQWLSRGEQDFRALENLLVPAPDDAIAMYPVSPDVNSVRNNRPDLIEPLEE